MPIISFNISNHLKKFLRQMKELVLQGTDHINELISKQKMSTGADTWNQLNSVNIMPSDIAEGRGKPNNATEFSLTNGSTLYSLPPTDSSRGYTADLVIVDEAAFVPDEIFDMIIEPTVRHTGGKIVLLSTPNGQKGFFYRFFDPDDENEDIRQYSRYWWNWELCPAQATDRRWL